MFSIRNAETRSDYYSKLAEQGLEMTASHEDRQIQKQQQEAWCVRRVFNSLTDNRLVSWPLTVVQREEPDFEVVENGELYWLEVTRAISQEDAREWSVAAKKELGIYFIGDLGGRKPQDNPSTAAEIVCNIQTVINKKSKKKYVDSYPTDLLIYVEGNNTAWLDSEIATEDGKRYQNIICTFPYENSEKFKRIFFLWNSGKVFLFQRRLEVQIPVLSDNIRSLLKALN